MAEQNQEQTVDTTPDAVVNDAPTGEAKVSKYHEQALEMGWRPQEEWSGDPEDFVDAKEFVQRKSFYDRISTQSNEIKELKRTLSEFSDHFRKVEDYTRKQVLDELRAAKREALEVGNTDEVIRIDEAITDFKVNEKELERQKAEKQAAQANQPAPELVEWQSRNKWYTTNPEMTRYADVIARGLVAANPDGDKVAILKEIEKEVRQRFPDEFKSKRRDAAPAVESSSGGAKPKVDKAVGTPEEMAVAARFVRAGLYATTEDYIKALRKMEKGE